LVPKWKIRKCPFYTQLFVHLSTTYCICSFACLYDFHSSRSSFNRYMKWNVFSESSAGLPLATAMWMRKRKRYFNDLKFQHCLLLIEDYGNRRMLSKQNSSPHSDSSGNVIFSFIPFFSFRFFFLTKIKTINKSVSKSFLYNPHLILLLLVLLFLILPFTNHKDNNYIQTHNRGIIETKKSHFDGKSLSSSYISSFLPEKSFSFLCVPFFFFNQCLFKCEDFSFPKWLFPFVKTFSQNLNKSPKLSD
jgi:hypothetical protein